MFAFFRTIDHWLDFRSDQTRPQMIRYMMDEPHLRSEA
jgi:hypothetical protein